MQRLLITLVLLLALHVPVAGQVFGQNQSITVVDSGTACVTAPAACATFALDSNSAGVTLSVSGTWTGTLTFEGTNNDGIWSALGLTTNLATGAQASTTTANGLYAITNAGVIKVRARATAAITGSALVTAARGSGVARAPGVAPFGTGGASLRVGGVLNSQFTPANNGTTVETDLHTFTLPANSLFTNGQGVRVTAWGITAANGNTKTIKVYFGATVIATRATTSSATPWVVRATLLRVTATTQVAGGEAFETGNGGGPTHTTPAETLSGAVIIKTTGQSSVASNDVTETGFLIEALP